MKQENEQLDSKLSCECFVHGNNLSSKKKKSWVLEIHKIRTHENVVK